MTGPTLAAILRKIGWSAREFAGRLRCDETTVRRMLAGRRPIPPDLARWAERAARWHETWPVPAWRDERVR